ncbi:MAG: RNA-binding protein [Candidatus Melainabacteria bacterium]|jgi:RNA recognition motif-containing protein|nr:RNA-binding protein [Candidatus Melainabacteria bacterium]
MNNKLFMGNLDYSVTSEELKAFLSEKWEVTECRVIEGKGFGFVTFASADAATQAKDELNDAEFKGRKLKADFAKERERTGGGDRGGDRRGGNGGGGYKPRY